MSWRLFWAVVLILLGIVLLLINLDILPGNAWNYIFPAILVLGGIVLMVGWRGGSRQLEAVSASAPLEGATHAAITLKHGAGQLNVRAGSDPTLLFTGTFGGGVDKKLKQDNGTAFLELKTPSDVWSNLAFPGVHGLRWDLQLHPTIPTTLKYEGGAAETKMDLSGIHLTTLEINTGASSTDVVLPPPHGTLRVVVHAGAASVKLRLPQNAPAAIRGTMGLGSLDIDKSRFPDRGLGVYQSDDYANAPDRIEMTVEGGVGAVQIR
ncbi:MAG: hypothetical protein HY741_14835 [Chloroflexi bacterium]|nr:hypothetical protein [Chloroflexota bacterium]